MPLAPVNEVELHYEVDGDGPPCLVLHGGLGFDHLAYRRTLQPLADRLRLVFYDHRGNGRSSRPPLETITMAQLADDAVALADHLGIDDFVVLGHSYGGFVAQELALRHPDRVRALLLVDTTPGQFGTGESEGDTEPGPPQPPELVAMLSQIPSTDDEMTERMPALHRFYFHARADHEIDAVFDGTRYSLGALIQGFFALAHWSSVDRLQDITCPTLLVYGRHDVMTSWPQAHRIARRLPNADVAILEHSAHYPWIDEPDAFFDVVGRWLDRLT